MFFAEATKLSELSDDIQDLDFRQSQLLTNLRILTAKRLGINVRRARLVSRTTGRQLYCRHLLNGIFCVATLGCISSIIFQNGQTPYCPAGYDSFLPFHGQCYSDFHHIQDWHSAESRCKNDSGSLLEVYTYSEMAYVGEIMNFSRAKNLWLGLSDDKIKHLYLWATADKSPEFDMPWAPHYPLRELLWKTCVSQLHAPLSWINRPCTDKLPFICKWTKRNVKTIEPDTRNEITTRDVDSFNLEPWAFDVYTGSSEFFVMRTNHGLSWNDSRKLCMTYGMDLPWFDQTAKFLHVKYQLGKKSKEYRPLTDEYTRFWIGAIRSSNARSQYEFEWINGLKQDLRHNSWQIYENSWTTKCIYAFIQHQVDNYKPLFYMTACEETSYFEAVVCEKIDEKHACLSDSDCHELAVCVKSNCLCSRGFAGNGYFCFDVNECCGMAFRGWMISDDEVEVAFCADNYNGCTNTWGSFHCYSCHFTHYDPHHQNNSSINSTISRISQSEKHDKTTISDPCGK